MGSKDIDIAIIGAGPAGLAAAIKAKEMGVKNVTIFERADSLGGLLDQCIHNGFGLLFFKEDLTGPEYADRFIKKAMELDLDLQLNTMVTRISSEKGLSVISGKDGAYTCHPKAIILAMGCRERPRGALAIPGTRPAGIFTAGTAQRLINVDGYIPGKKIVILGSGDIGMIMARRLSLEGAEIAAMVEIMPYAGGLIRNEVQCVKDFDIPILFNHTISMIYGTDRIEAVDIVEVDENRNPVEGTEKKIECDTLLISAGLIPENELSLMADVKIDPLTGGPFVDEKMQTNIPGIFAAGNVVHVNDIVDNVTVEGEMAGGNAAKFVLGEKVQDAGITLKPGNNIKYVVPNFISGLNPIKVYTRVKEPQSEVTLSLGDVMKKSYRYVKPSEMLMLELTEEDVGKGLSGINELVIDCQKRENN